MTTTALRIGLSELRRHPGNRREFRQEVDLDQLAITTARVVADRPAVLEVVVESLSDGVTVNGAVTFAWEGECRRCLEPTEGTTTAPLHEVFKDQPESEDIQPIDNDSIDLGPAVRDAVVLALPLAPLCRPDCPGPDPDNFPVATAAEPSTPPADPRWAALAELDFDRDVQEG